MRKIIQFYPKKTTFDRKKFSFINRNTRVYGEDGDIRFYPCIALYEIETDIPVLYTGLERFVEPLAVSEMLDGDTLAKKAIAVCNFLNYLLHETELNGIHECTTDTIRGYLRYARTKKSGKTYTHETWVRYRSFLFDFLKRYFDCNKDRLSFGYNGDGLQVLTIVDKRDSRNRVVIAQNAGLNVKGPVTTHRKNRILVSGYLDLLLYEAKKYEPSLVLAIALQAYAGLREGEVVNLTCGRVEILRKQFGVATGIELDLRSAAPFFEGWKKKTKPGSIKKPRIQCVYDDFVRETIDLYEEHIYMMEAKRLDTGRDAPLFVNSHGNPLTVQSYSGRVKALFYDHFLPALKQTCELQNTWAENAAFIEIYESEYPGAHMFRHWFTMYLITKASLSSGEVMRWRGDSVQESMTTYIHENADLLQIYRESSYTFQLHLLEDINHGGF